MPATPSPELLAKAFQHIAEHQDQAKLRDWLLNQLADSAADADSARQQRGEMAAFALALWNISPLPDNDFRPAPLPWPGRNDPCLCGSGRKSKQCCRLPAQSLSLAYRPALRILLCLPLEQQVALVEKQRVDGETLAQAADHHLKTRQAPEAALALLEPLLHPQLKVTANHLPAVDRLARTLGALGQQDRALAAVERLTVQQKDRKIRGLLRLRQYSLEREAGDLPAAAASLKQAARECPDHPTLAVSEVELLSHQGKLEQAAGRAAYWFERLQQRETAPRATLSLLQHASADPKAVFLDRAPNPDEFDEDEIQLEPDWLQRLEVLLDSLATEEPYCLLSNPDGSQQLQTRSDSEAQYQQWQNTDTANGPEPQLALLEKHPGLLQRFDVLVDVIQLLHTHADTISSRGRELMNRLLVHGCKRVDSLLADTAEATFSARQPANLPMLNLLERLARYLETQLGDQAAANKLRQRLLALNPEDHFDIASKLKSVQSSSA